VLVKKSIEQLRKDTDTLTYVQKQYTFQYTFQFNYINPRSVSSISASLKTNRGTFSVHHLTSVKIVNGVAVRVEDTEAGRLVVVLVSVPEDVHLVESLAGDGAPESLGVLDGSDLV
jgi:hypothetical protein